MKNPYSPGDKVDVWAKTFEAETEEDYFACEIVGTASGFDEDGGELVTVRRLSDGKEIEVSLGGVYEF